MPTSSPQAQGTRKRVVPGAINPTGAIRRAEAAYTEKNTLADLGLQESRFGQDYDALKQERGAQRFQEQKSFSADYGNRGLATSGAYQFDLGVLMAAQTREAAADERKFSRGMEDINIGRYRAGQEKEKEFGLATYEDVYYAGQEEQKRMYVPPPMQQLQAPQGGFARPAAPRQSTRTPDSIYNNRQRKRDTSQQRSSIMRNATNRTFLGF